MLAGFDTPTLVGLPGRAGQRGVASFRLSAQTTRALGELAGCYQTSVSTVVQAAFAQLLMSLSGQPDVAFGATVSGDGATDIAGAESTVGLSANTMPVRATITATTTTTDLLDQLQHFHNHTTPHQHLGLSEIHCVTGHDRLFDTLFVWENNPNDTGAIAADRELQ
ncbi:hypothetical protein A5745_04725 [Mycobacterium sp. IS-2888]|uniref:condensation domain-containing protein n=1 Tax=Mycobacterium sp. IS-2888 TaxID=1834159 RepID=UPI00097A2656|nr:hypothetical protein A5745_04725 [Mycobacterium sp. IS-2888]